MKPLWCLTLLVLRRSRLAWLFLIPMLAFNWILVGLMDRSIPSQVPMQSLDGTTVGQTQMLLTSGFFWLGMAAGLVGEALRSLRRVTAFHIAPGHGVQLRRFLWLLLLLLWFSNVAPMLLILGAGHWWWAVPISLGLTAAVIAALTTIFALGRIELFAIGGLLLLFPLLWKPLRNEIYRLTLSASSVDPLHAKWGGVFLGFVLLALWAWAVRALVKHFTQPGFMPSGPDRNGFMGLTRPTADYGQLRRGDPRAAFMPTAPLTTGRRVIVLAALFAAYYVLGASIYSPLRLPALLALWIYVAGMSAAPFWEGVWVSLRLMLLPGGLARSHQTIWHLHRYALKQNLLQMLLNMVVGAAALCLACGLPLQSGLPMVAVAVGPLLFFSSVVFFARVVPDRFIGPRTLTFVLQNSFLLLLAVVGHFVLQLRWDNTQALWSWAVLSMAMSLPLSVALLRLAAPLWVRFDWTRMPALPPVNRLLTGRIGEPLRWGQQHRLL